MGTPEVDELERLARLHRSGDLSDAEFAAAKTRLLGARPRPRGLLVIAAIAVATLAAVGAGWAIGQRRGQDAPPKAVQTVLADAQVSRLQRVFQRDMLEAQVTYLENIIGPARNVDGEVRTYVVDGCLIQVRTAGGAVASFGIPHLSPTCTVSLRQFGLDADRADLTTFGQLAGQGDTTWSADCIRGCGNAFDPSVYARIETAHANAYLMFRAGVVLVDGAAIDAALAWADEMTKAKGEDYVIETRFNCDRAAGEAAARFFKDVRISSIEIGSFDEPKC